MIQKAFKSPATVRFMIQLFFAAPIMVWYTRHYFHANVSHKLNSTEQENSSDFSQMSNDPWVVVFNTVQNTSAISVKNSSGIENATWTSTMNCNQGALMLTTGGIFFLVMVMNFWGAVAAIPRKENSPSLVWSKKSATSLRKAFKNVTFDKSCAVILLILYAMLIELIDSMAASRGNYILCKFYSISIEASEVFDDLHLKCYVIGSLVALTVSSFVSGRTMLIFNVILSLFSLTLMSVFQYLENDCLSLVFFLIHHCLRPSMFSSLLVFVTEYLPFTGFLSASFFIATVTGRCLSRYFILAIMGLTRHAFLMAILSSFALHVLALAELNIHSFRRKLEGKKQRDIQPEIEQQQHTKNVNMASKNVVSQV